MAEHCGYGEPHDEMMWDQIVVGVHDRKLSEKLEMAKKLTLDTTVAEARKQSWSRSSEPSLGLTSAKVDL